MGCCSKHQSSLSTSGTAAGSFMAVSLQWHSCVPKQFVHGGWSSNQLGHQQQFQAKQQQQWEDI
jgi:hypothetical protein